MSDAVRLYAGTQDGVHVWRRQGGGFEAVSSSFSGAIIEALAGCTRSPERVFAGVAHDGLYRTIDGGKQWTKVLEGDVRSVAVDPASDDVLYAGMEPVWLYRSEDGGDSWEALTSVMAFALQNGVRFFQTFVHPVEAHPDAVRYKWWFPRRPHVAHITNIFIHPDNSNILFLSVEHGSILRSHDRGRTWEDVTGGIEYKDIHILRNLPHSFETYFVSTARGFFTSNDPARGWVRAENGFTRDYFHDFVILPPSGAEKNSTFVVATADQSPGFWNRPENSRAAIYRSFDDARSWHRATAGLPDILAAMVWALAPHPNNPDILFAGLGNVSRGYALPLPHYMGSGGPGQILQSRDRGVSWEDLGLALPPDRVLWAAAD